MNNLENPFKDYKKIHCIGIGGSGMFPIVEILHAEGHIITGSDNNPGDNINKERKMGIKVTMEHLPENVHGADLVIYSAAIQPDNPERVEAERLGIPCIERSIALGWISRLYDAPICISGTHGKTTTTAITTQILEMSGRDPGAVIGGKLPLIDGYGKSGRGKNIVIEACEFSNTYHQLVPETAVVLNIDRDHLDFFKTMDNLKASFKKFSELSTNKVIANSDDANTMEALSGVDRKFITFGIDTDADYKADNIVERRPGFYSFSVEKDGKKEADIDLNIPCRHNIYNALAAYASCREAGCTPKECVDGISKFRGAGRRFEFLGVRKGIVIADDYAHHPTEIKATLHEAGKLGYNHVWVVFQPHVFSRVKSLKNEFIDALKEADRCVITEILGGREKLEDFNIYSEDLAKEIPGAVCINDNNDVVDYIYANAKPGDLVLTMGGGDIYKAAHLMLERYPEDEE